MAKQGGEPPLGRCSSPGEVLAFLASLLGAGMTKEDADEASHREQEKTGKSWTAIPWQAASDSASEVDSDPDFSSFPSLSLERSPNEQFEDDLNRRESIEAHVSALLARPILVSNANNSRGEGGADDNDSDTETDTMEFIAEDFPEVPKLMLHNFFASFSTLMNSRLRAYATFLARHGLSLFECSETAEELEEGVTGVEQKLETMLEIGRLVSSHSVETSFQARPKEATYSTKDDSDKQVSMPLKMNASIAISLPHPLGGQNEVVTVSFVANGIITGIFADKSRDTLLRVVQVDLHMSELLPSMIEQASRVISRIVEMTNAAYSLALPRYEEAESEALRHEVPASPAQAGAERENGEKRRLHIVSPNLVPAVDKSEPSSMSNLNLGDEFRLSAENLVDYVFGEINESVIRPPAAKKARISTSKDSTTGP